MVLQPYAPMKWESLAGWLILYFPGFARNFDFFFSGCQAFGGFFCCHVHTTKCTLSRCCFRNQQTTRTQYVATALPLFVGQNDMVFWRDLWRKPSFRVKRIESLFFFNVGWFGEIFVILQNLCISSTHMWIPLHQIHIHLPTTVRMPMIIRFIQVPVGLMICHSHDFSRQFVWIYQYGNSGILFAQIGCVICLLNMVARWVEGIHWWVGMNFSQRNVTILLIASLHTITSFFFKSLPSLKPAKVPKIVLPKGKVIFPTTAQPPIFRCELLVSGRAYLPEVVKVSCLSARFCRHPAIFNHRKSWDSMIASNLTFSIF